MKAGTKSKHSKPADATENVPAEKRDVNETEGPENKKPAHHCWLRVSGPGWIILDI